MTMMDIKFLGRAIYKGGDFVETGDTVNEVLGKLKRRASIPAKCVEVVLIHGATTYEDGELVYPPEHPPRIIIAAGSLK